MSGTHLLLLSLGPVQDFIAAARRCQDLWYGSYMLSELSRAAAEAVQHECGAEALIFPGALGNDKAAVANKILVRCTSSASAKKAAEAAKSAVSDTLRAMSAKAWPPKDTLYFMHETAEAQLNVDELMEFFWVMIPIGDGPDGYKEARDRAERTLAARKATKNWGPQRSSKDEIGVPKSSLDGVRESVIHEDAYDHLSAEQLYKKFGIKKGKERLCGVALLKRRGVQAAEGDERRPAFHSTSHMAAAPLLTRFTVAGTPEKLGAYLDRFDRRCGVTIRTGEAQFATKIMPPAPFKHTLDAAFEAPRTFGQRGGRGTDGTVFFEQRLAPDVFGDDRKTEASDAARALSKLLDVEPCPYYAMLRADGDSMGKAIEDMDGWVRHQKFSGALDTFASGSRATVEDHGGSLIYAGGDDVFAMVPLHTALACARKLSEDFNKVGTGLNLKKPLTLSVGLAIVHHLTPMTRAIQLSKDAEHAAKEVPGKDALAIIMDKRSGGITTARDKWDTKLDERLNEWAHLIFTEGLPNGLAYELERMLTTFEDKDSKFIGEPGDKAAVVALAQQIINRKRAKRGEQKLNCKLVSSDPTEKYFEGEDDPHQAVKQLSKEIQIARLLLTAYKMAWGPILEGGAHV